MNLAILKAELALPAYNGLSHQAAADALNTVNVSIDRTIIPAYEVIDATVATDYSALTATERDRYAAITGAGQINVQNANVRLAFAAMFGAGTQTRTNLLALQTALVSRAQQLGIGGVTSQDVKDARGGQ